MTVYLTNATSNNEHYDADCNYAVVYLTPEFLKKLFAWKKAFLANKAKYPDVDAWQIGDTHATFVSSNAVQKVAEAAYDDLNSGDDPVILRDGESINLDHFEVTVSDEVHLLRDGFWWEGQPKHSGVVVSSDFVSWKWLTHCVHCQLPKKDHVKGKCLFSSTNYKGHDATTERKPKNRKRGKQQV